MSGCDATVISLEVQCRHSPLFRVLQQSDCFSLCIVFGLRSFTVVKLSLEEVQDRVLPYYILLTHIMDQITHCLATVILISLFSFVFGSFCDVLQTLFVILALPSFLVVHFLVFHTYFFSINGSY